MEIPKYTDIVKYKGRKEFKIHNKLEAGDVVLMIREQGGKHYYVIDRIAK